MALNITSGQSTEWNLEEGSEDLEFRFQDDGESRRFRAIARLVCSKIYEDVSDVTTFGAATNFPPSNFGDIKSNGPTTVTFSFGTAYNQEIIVSDRIVPHETKGGSFMKRIMVVEAATDWADYTGDD